jgi:hypothetical protein
VAARRMRCDAESAADDAVLSAGIRPTHYAEHLVGLARTYSGSSFAALAMAERSMLDARVQAILDPTQPRCGVTKMDVLKIAAVGLAMTSVLALARPSFAEAPDPTPVTATPDAATTETAPTALDVAATVKPQHGTQHIVRQIRVVTTAEVPPAPDAPLAPEAPSAPPASVAPNAPPAPPVPPARIRNVVHVSFSDAEKAALRRMASEEARQAMAAARLAIANAHLDQVIAKAMRQAQEAFGKAKLSQAETERAIADAHIDQVVNEAMRQAEDSMARARIEQKSATSDLSDRPESAPEAPSHK